MGYRVYSVDGQQGEVALTHLRTQTIGITLDSPVAGTHGVWKAPVACHVTAVRGFMVGGATCEVQAYKNGSGLRGSVLSVAGNSAWAGGTSGLAAAGVLAVAAGDTITAAVSNVVTSGNTKALVEFTPAATGTDAFDYTDTKAVVKFTPAAAGADTFDYSGASAQTFTINDGAGATTITLNADYNDLAGVVTAVDTALGTRYVVTADTTLVKIEAATAGAKTFVIAGTDAATITGSAGYVNTAGATNQITFTVDDGGGAQTITLNTDYTNLAGVVAAVDALLDAGYVVSADTTLVKIEAAVAGSKTFTIGGASAAAVTGSAGYVNTVGLGTGPTSISIQIDITVDAPA